jgi:2-methylisocitrate lyase-like PEP mutase family enzyme
MNALNTVAKSFKALHAPGKPLVLANVYDVTSARLVAALPGCKALATASWAVAKVAGTDDEKLGMQAQLALVRDIAAVAREAGKPLTVDFQAGYGDRLEEGIAALVDLGVVGINLEDADQATAKVMETDAAVDRVRRALAAAAKAGVPDFVVNARSDTWLRGGTLDESIRRGRLYLDAGATTIYVIGGGSPAGNTADEVRRMVEGLDGKVNIGLRLPKPGAEAVPLSSADLAGLGVARISVGPQIYLAAAEAIKTAAQKVFSEAEASAS